MQILGKKTLVFRLDKAKLNMPEKFEVEHQLLAVQKILEEHRSLLESQGHTFRI